MSRALTNRLSRLEAAAGSKALGYWHVIYERSPEDFEAQKAEFIQSGRAKPDDFFFDWNFNLAPEQREFKEPETIPVTGTHEERLDTLARPECQQ